MSSREAEPSEQGPRTLPTDDDSTSTLAEEQSANSGEVHLDENGEPIGLILTLSPVQVKALGVEGLVMPVVLDGVVHIESAD